MTTPTADPTLTGFGSLGLSTPIVSAVSSLGYEEPTPIQREAIPLLLEGRDLLGQAGTGTGKTAAFSLPLLHRLATDPVRQPGAQALILVPTRELAVQVAEAITKFAAGLRLNIVALYGGAPMEPQVRALRRGADIIVATPGRALDHLRRETLDLTQLRILVLDEADEMLDMGFAEDLDAILSETPESRQTALFAATFAPRIVALTGRHLKDPARVTIARETREPGTLPRVRQVAYLVPRHHKAAALGRVLEYEQPKSAIIFCRTRLEVDELTETLAAHGHGAQALHGGMAQKQRDRVMQLFRQGKATFLVATDVAARGLDIDHVSHVFNYDVPNAPEVYVHRIGRTGRAGRDGVAITFASPRDQRTLRHVEALTRQKITIAQVPSVAELKARRLEATTQTLREQMSTAAPAGELEDARGIVLALAKEFEMADIAAVAVKLMQDATARGQAATAAQASASIERLDAAPRERERTRELDRPRDYHRPRDYGRERDRDRDRDHRDLRGGWKREPRPHQADAGASGARTQEQDSWRDAATRDAWRDHGREPGRDPGRDQARVKRPAPDRDRRSGPWHPRGRWTGAASRA